MRSCLFKKPLLFYCLIEFFAEAQNVRLIFLLDQFHGDLRPWSTRVFGCWWRIFLRRHYTPLSVRSNYSFSPQPEAPTCAYAAFRSFVRWTTAVQPHVVTELKGRMPFLVPKEGEGTAIHDGSTVAYRDNTQNLQKRRNKSASLCNRLLT